MALLSDLLGALFLCLLLCTAYLVLSKLWWFVSTWVEMKHLLGLKAVSMRR